VDEPGGVGVVHAVVRWGDTLVGIEVRFKRIAAGASAEEKLALFSGTARRMYRLD